MASSYFTPSDPMGSLHAWETWDVDPVYLSEIIGKGGDNIKDLQSTLPLEIRINNDTKTLQVRGSEDGKDKFKNWLKKIKRTNKTWETWNVDPVYFSQITGRGGDNIKNLQSTLLLEICINNEHQTLLVRGSEYGKHKFKDWLKKLKRTNETWETWNVDPVYFSQIIGQGGKNIKDLQSTLPLEIHVDNDTKTLQVRGSEYGKHKFKDWLKKLKRTNKTWETWNVDPVYFSQIIGSGGDNIKNLQSTLLLEICINNEHQTLHVRGSEYGKHKFKDWLKRLKRTNETWETWNVDPVYFSQIIGQGGKNIKDLQSTLPLEIHVDNGTKTLLVRGSEDGKHKFKDWLKKLKRTNKTWETWNVDPVYFSQIIGMGGDNIKNLQSTLLLEICINNEHQTLLVRGSEYGKHKFKDWLKRLKLINETWETWNVDPVYFSQIIGQGEKNIKDLQSTLPLEIHVDNGTKTLLVRGSEDGKHKFKDWLKKLKRTNKTWETWNVDPVYFSQIIGMGGDNIKNLQSTLLLEICINNEHQTLLVRGSEYGKHKFKDWLKRLKLLNETWETWNIDPVYFSQIIGQGGKNIKDLQSMLPLEIHVDNDTKTLQVRGAEDGKHKFKDWLKKLKQTNETWETWNVDPGYFSQIIGQGGKNIKDLQSTLPLEIHVDNDTKTLQVRGSADGKHKFKDWLKKLKRTNETWETWNVDPVYFSQIIGQGGKNIKDLQSTLRLEIHVDNDTKTLQVRGSEDGKLKFKKWLERLTSLTWDVVEFVESKHIGLIIGRNGAILKNIKKMYDVKMKVEDNKLYINGGEEGKTDVLVWFKRYILSKNLELVFHESETRKLFFVGLEGNDNVILKKSDHNMDCVIDSANSSFRLKEITFQNMPELKLACEEALLNTRKMVDAASMNYQCRVLVHTGNIYFMNDPGCYRVQELLNNTLVNFTCMSKESIYLKKLHEMDLSVIRKYIRFDLNMLNQDENFRLRYKIFLNVSSDGHISVIDIDDLEHENQRYYDLQAGPGHFFNLTKRTTRIDIVDPNTCLTTRINVLLICEDEEYEDKLKRHVEILRESGFFENIIISEQNSEWELEVPKLSDSWYISSYRRSERNDYSVESTSHILRITKDCSKVRDPSSKEGADLTDMFFINIGLQNLFVNNEWSVEEALKGIEKTLLYSSRVMKYILK